MIIYAIDTAAMTIIDINGNERECVTIAPDPLWPGYMKVAYISKNGLAQTRQEWYPKQDFVKNNPTLSSYLDGATAVAREDLGAVSQASSMTLVDKSKHWHLNEFAGYPVWIARGVGEGQTRTVLMNTEDTIVIDAAWEVIPTSSSQYVISYNVHDPQVMGNTLPAARSAKKRVRKERKKKQ